MNLLVWVAGVIAVIGFWGLIAAGFFLLFPLLVWEMLGEDAAPRFDVFDPARHAAPPAVTTFIRDNLAPLTAEGLQLVGDLIRERETIPGYLRRSRWYRSPQYLSTRVAILQHDDGVVGTVAVVSSPAGGASPLVGFTAELSDGRVLDVNNAGAPTMLAERPGHLTYRLPEVRDPLRLYRIFRVLLRRQFGAAPLRRREIAADPARFLAENSDEAYQWQVTAGFFRLDRKANRYRPTLKSAYVMSWKNLTPFGQLRRAAVRRRARALLEEIGMDGPDLRPVAAPAVRPVGGGRLVVPFAVLATIAVGAIGSSEYQARRPIDRESLVVPRDFPGAVRALEKLARTTARPVVVRGLDGQIDTTAGFYVEVRASRARALLDSGIVRQFHEQGFSMFWWIGNRGRPWWLRSRGRPLRLDRVALHPSPDKYEVVRAMTVGPETIVPWFQALERDRRLELNTIGPNKVEGWFTVDSAEARDVARRLAEFCRERPRTLTTEERAAALVSDGGFFRCWWEPRGREGRRRLAR